MVYRDKTFCASPGCKNECDRKMTDAERKEIQMFEARVCYAYFCGKPNEKKSTIWGVITDD